jgi:hypothetical protein
MSGVIPLLPLHAFMVWTGTTLPQLVITFERFYTIIKRFLCSDTKNMNLLFTYEKYAY